MDSEKVAYWRAHQSAQRGSGLSVAAYCRRHDLGYARWMYWQRRLGGALVPIAVVPATAPGVPSAALTLELTLPGGASLRVSGATVSDLVALTRGLSC